MGLIIQDAVSLRAERSEGEAISRDKCHCEEGALPDEAISCCEGIASPRFVYGTEEHCPSAQREGLAMKLTVASHGSGIFILR